ncbi:hypothetical protein [Xylophilus sp.]|uniref:hypothetical protein n=1 Tax=Xylophilus sp. TaxID=2653893 RepID=UPI0013B8380D|nr:hypothetical protein [Xylophilus sp.]KAF1045013.1 MAG: hypothetical protein GAK38_03239 [Xylophilus sp.]
MSPIHLTLRPDEQRLHQLPAGSELRCLCGTVMLLAMPGLGWPPRVLPAGQAMHFAQPAWVALRADGAATVAIAVHQQEPAAPKESRQALDGLWRLGRECLRVLRRRRRAA